MHPRIIKHERRLHLTYELPHRIRCSAIPSSPAPNGSTIIFYGHDHGIKVLWKGGRKVKQQHIPQNDPDVIDLDVDDHAQLPFEYEEEEEDLKTEAPYPSILYDLDIQVDQPVSKIAIIEDQTVQQAKTTSSHALLAVATTEGVIQLLTVPLDVPRPADRENVSASILSKALILKDSSSYVRALATKLVPGDEKDVIVAAGSEYLETWQLSSSNLQTGEGLRHSSALFTGVLVGITFSPASRSTQFLAVNKFGTVSVYDITAPTQDRSGDIRWLHTLTTPYEKSKTTQASRKRILDARFVLNGRYILALLYDAQWGIWNTRGTKEGKGIEHFESSGHLDSATSTASAESKVRKTASSLLTPMTPNTRKSKSENFFASHQTRQVTGVVSGGIAVSRASAAASSTDDSVMIWHRSDLYAIPSFEAFYKRSAAGTTGSGSLHTPGITSIPGVHVFNERITSLCQLKQAQVTPGLGLLKSQRDFLLSTEHRLIIVQNPTTRDSTQGPFKQAEVRDQRMLDAGELDVGGMDRMLNSMSNNRKVDFAK